MKRATAFSYLRFSSKKQEKGDSIRRQVMLRDAFIARQNLVLDDQLTLSDLGVSAFRGANAKKGHLALFLDAVQQGLVPAGSYFLIENVDRLSRQSPWDALPTLQAIVNAGINVVTLEPERVYNLAAIRANPFLLQEWLLYQTRANSESATKAFRLNEIWAVRRSRARATGKAATSRGPWWLEVRDGKWITIAKRVEIVRRIFRDAANGIGAHRIVQSLNADAVKPYRGKLWNQTAIRRTLKNRSVLGEFQPHRLVDGVRVADGDVVATYYPRVIDDKTWERAQSAGVLRQSSAPRGKELVNTFAGLLRCRHCNSTVYRKVISAKGKRHTYYKCSKAELHGARACPQSGYWRVDKFELFFRERGVLDRAPGGGGSLEAFRRLREIEDGIEHVREEIENLVAGIAHAKSSKALAKKLSEREANLEQQEQQRAALSEQVATASTRIVEQRNDAARKLLAAKTPNVVKLNAALRTVIDHIDIDARGQDIVVHWRAGGSTEGVVGSEFTPFLQKKDERVTVAQARAWKAGRSVKLA